MNVPASATVAGFVPPVEKMKESAEPPLVKDPVPNALVMVSILFMTVQPPGLVLMPPVTEVSVQRA